MHISLGTERKVFMAGLFEMRREVIQALSEDSDRSFERRLVADLETQFPSAARMPQPELLAAVRRQISKAKSYGLVNEKDVGTYVVCAYLLGEDFDMRFPAARQTLISSVLDSPEKAEWLKNWIANLFSAFQK